MFLGGNIKNLGRIDGVDQWNSFTNTSKQIRSTVLINIDETIGEEALILNQWKVVKSKMTFVIKYDFKLTTLDLCTNVCTIFLPYLVNLSHQIFAHLKCLFFLIKD